MANGRRLENTSFCWGFPVAQQGISIACVKRVTVLKVDLKSGEKRLYLQ
jgi:hypothetical protein